MKAAKIMVIMFLGLFLTACSETEELVEGEFVIGNMYGGPFEPGDSYTFILPIEWTGEEPATITSVELIKMNGEPVTFEEDGIAYEFYGADPLKRVGLYAEDHYIGEVEDINGFEVQGESRIVTEVRLGEVEEDDHRNVKITYSVNGEEYEEITEWDTFRELATSNEN